LYHPDRGFNLNFEDKGEQKAMKVHIWLWGHLTQYVPGGNKARHRVVEVSQGTTIRNALDELKIPEWAVQLIFVNGEHAKDSDVLKEGDRLGVFPRVLAGG
jgi:sulfur carrier protein ThiS